MNSFQEYCNENGKKELLEQWSPRNGELKPSDVAAYANRKVWWICGEGHVWKATVNTRVVKKCDCPVCAGHVGPGKKRYYENIQEEMLKRNVK